MALNYSIINNKTIIHSDYLGEDVYNLLDMTFKIPSNYNYNVFEVSEEYICRPDLISYDMYGDTKYADIICKLNGISNPFELNSGTKIILPDSEYIQKFIINEQDVEVEQTYMAVPTPKKKMDKRGANEAIVGDKRFKIDSVSKVVIY